MHFLALLYADVAAMPVPGTEEYELDLVGFARFGEQAGSAVVAGEAVGPQVSVRGDATKDATLDDPIGLVGFYVIEVDQIDQATGLARLIPVVRYGAVEVRPLNQWFDRRPQGSQPGRYLATLHHPSGTPANQAASHDDPAHARFAALADRTIVAGGPIHPPHAARTLRTTSGALESTSGPAAPNDAPSGALYVLGGPNEQVEELLTLLPLASGAHAALRPLVSAD